MVSFSTQWHVDKPTIIQLHVVIDKSYFDVCFIYLLNQEENGARRSDNVCLNFILQSDGITLNDQGYFGEKLTSSITGPTKNSYRGCVIFLLKFVHSHSGDT